MTKHTTARLAVDMFADCSDLPLWSGTAVRVDDSPFAPAAADSAAPTESLPLPGFEMEPAAPALNAYELRQECRRERLAAAAERAQQESSAQYQRSREIVSHIPPGQPILVGHHSERRHRHDLEKSDNAMRKAIEASERAEDLASKAAAVGTGGISSDDPDAVINLRTELEAAKAKQARMVAANKLIKKNDRDGLAAMGFGQTQIDALFTPDFAGRIGYADYEIRNNGANIRRIEQRIEQLARNAAAESSFEPIIGEGWTISAEDNRVLITFEPRQDTATTDRLKSRGFRWTPSRGAWTRQFNSGAVYAARWCVGAE